MPNSNALAHWLRVFTVLSSALSASSILGGNLPGDPWGFTAEDIYGQSVTPGETTYDPASQPATGGTYTVTADGHAIWDAADDFRFVHLPATGDFNISVCVLENPFQGGGQRWAEAGIMVRQNNTPGSAHVCQVVSRGEGTAFLFRDTQNADSSWVGNSEPSILTTFYPFWLRLRREGNILYGDYSYDGRNWRHQSTAVRTVVMTNSLLVGICLTSHEPGVLTTTRFTDFRVNGLPFQPGTRAVALGDRWVAEGNTARLDGSSSSSTSSRLSYLWRQTGGASVALSNPTQAVVSFTAPLVWNYMETLTFELRVDDGRGQSESVSTAQFSVNVRNRIGPTLRDLPIGYVKDLLHLGPTSDNRIEMDNITPDYLAKFGGETNIQPKTGDVFDFSSTGIKTSRQPLIWTQELNPSGQFGGAQELEHMVMYWHVYIITPDDREARFHFRNDDELRVWNNGVLVLARDLWDEDQEHASDFVLQKGINSMVFKLHEGSSPSYLEGNRNYMAVRITDRSDLYYQDLQYTLDPPLPLRDAYAARTLPQAFRPGDVVDISLALKANPTNPPPVVTINEVIPEGFGVLDPGMGTVIGNTLQWNLNEATNQLLRYRLKATATAPGTAAFNGSVNCAGINVPIYGDTNLFAAPAAPSNLRLEMLLTANLSWNPVLSSEVTGYRIYRSVNAGT